jgi:hypothetical protein
VSAIAWSFQLHFYQSNHNGVHNSTLNRHQSITTCKDITNRCSKDIISSFALHFFLNLITFPQMPSQYFLDGYPGSSRPSPSEHLFYFSCDSLMRCRLNWRSNNHFKFSFVISKCIHVALNGHSFKIRQLVFTQLTGILEFSSLRGPSILTLTYFSWSYIEKGLTLALIVERIILSNLLVCGAVEFSFKILLSCFALIFASAFSSFFESTVCSWNLEKKIHQPHVQEHL